jgi:glycosyltransferase involved in cell wall biosynthesis
MVASGADSSMVVEIASIGDPTVLSYCLNGRKILNKIRPHLVKPIMNIFHTKNNSLHSIALLPSDLPNMINNSDVDLVNLHWINSEMLSVADISRIRKPLFWTLHDMWPICGAEHYATDDRWLTGYFFCNRPASEKGFDLNRWVWRRKIKSWKRPIHIIAPSHWLAECARKSQLMRRWEVSVIHYPIDTDKWKPIEKGFARDLLGLPKDRRFLLFGAQGGTQDPRKGFDLLCSTLEKLRQNSFPVEVLIFGETSPRNPPDLGVPIHYAGKLSDDLSLRALYCAADAFILPSRQDNLPNTGIEAMACGTPIIAFNVGGLPDLVVHRETGWLARQFDADDMASGVKWVLSDAARHARMRELCRQSAVSRFSYKVISENYSNLYMGKLGF